MKSRNLVAFKLIASLVLVLSILPARAFAQAGGGRAGGAGMGGMGMIQQLRTVIPQLGLSDDQKAKIQDIMQQAMSDIRDALQGLQGATAEERQAKMQDLQKLMTDTRTKIEAELTPEQKAKLYPLLAKAALKQMTDMLAALKTVESTQKMSEDVIKQLNGALDDSGKALDGCKTDADGVTDADGLKGFQQKLTQVQMDLRKQVVDILGQDDAQKLMQAARQAMRPGGAGGAARQTAPTTAPAAK